jgi:hypothetical protein
MEGIRSATTPARRHNSSCGSGGGANTEAGAAGLGDDLVAANKWWRRSGGRQREIGLGLDVLVDLRRREGGGTGAGDGWRFLAVGFI